jgi:glycosyltransferase involved in cell wall biosynthesis
MCGRQRKDYKAASLGPYEITKKEYLVKILLDLAVFERPTCGIGRVTLGLYDACVRLDSSLAIEGIYHKSLKCELPEFIDARAWARYFPRQYVPLWRSVALPYYGKIKRPDFIHFPANEGAFRLHKGSRIILTIHDVIPLILPDIHFNFSFEEAFYRWTSQQSIYNSDLVITVSEYSKRDIYRHLDCRSEILVVPPANFLNFAKAEEKDRQLQPEKHYLYFGGYDLRKGLDVLVSTFHELFTAGLVKLPLIIAGHPRYKRMPGLKEKIAAAAKDGAIVQTGLVSDSELVNLLRNARALIYPSRYEGFGLPPLEAMTFGCPVITTWATSIPEVCGDAALYVTPDDKWELAKAILEIENNGDLRQDLRFRGIERAKHFSWEKSAGVFLNALCQLQT